MNNPKKIAIVGLGYVGLPLAAEFGKKQEVIGFDTNSKRIIDLNKYFDKTRECSRDQLLEAKFLSFSNKITDIADAKIIIITVPTPITKSMRPDLSLLVNACRDIASVLKTGDIVVFESTVYPGVTEDICVPILEKISSLRFNKDFFCGYSPERVNPGDKVNTLTKIRKITSGSTKEVADEIDSLYSSIITAGTWRAQSIQVAEAAKVIENSQRDLNIAFVNELSVIFDRIGIDTMDVLQAAGSKWNFLPFKPGMVGGHCIGVDPYYLTHKAEEVGYNPQVILAGRRINDNVARYAAKSIVKKMLNNNINVAASTIVVFGITFKENCPDIRNSKVIDLISEFESWNLKVLVVDPWADPKEVYDEYGITLHSVDELGKVDSIVIAVAHNEFRKTTPALFRSYCSNENPVIGDLKSILPRAKLTKHGFTIFRL